MADLYLDNDVSTGIAAELITLSHSATTALAQQLRQANDVHHLLFATQQNWILVIHNYPDYLLLHRAWLLWRQAGDRYRLPDHAGILRIPRQRWDDRDAALQINAFLQSQPVLPNRLYPWTPSQGWMRRE